MSISSSSINREFLFSNGSWLDQKPLAGENLRDLLFYLKTTERASQPIHALNQLPLFNDLRGIADNDRPRFHIFHRHGPRADDRAFADFNSWAHKRIRTNPRLICDDDRWLEQRQIQLPVIMGSGAKLRPV